MINEIMVWLANFSIGAISFLGYPGLAFLMMLESMVFPLPSELVMPFAGFLISKGEMGFVWVIVFSTMGSLIGSLISYAAGRYLGIAVIKKFGKYLLMNKGDLLTSQRWFEKKGEKTIFISRFIPVVRHFISIPAGIARMNLKKFCVYTIIGATLWNSFLAWLGWLLGENWASVRHYTEYISVGVVILLLLGIIYFIHKHVVNRKM